MDKATTSRGRMNGLSFAEIKRQIKYKADWEEVTVMELPTKDTCNTSQTCYKCEREPNVTEILE